MTDRENKKLALIQYGIERSGSQTFSDRVPFVVPYYHHLPPCSRKTHPTKYHSITKVWKTRIAILPRTRAQCDM